MTLEEAKKMVIVLKRLGWENEDIKKVVTVSESQIRNFTKGMD